MASALRISPTFRLGVENFPNETESGLSVRLRRREEFYTYRIFLYALGER
jgi:hypothetical protein